MLHGLAWKSKRLDTGARRKDATRRDCSVEADDAVLLGSSVPSIIIRSKYNKRREEVNKERNNKVLEPEFVVGIIDDEDDDGIETKLCTTTTVVTK